MLCDVFVGKLVSPKQLVAARSRATPDHAKIAHRMVNCAKRVKPLRFMQAELRRHKSFDASDVACVDRHLAAVHQEMRLLGARAARYQGAMAACREKLEARRRVLDRLESDTHVLSLVPDLKSELVARQQKLQSILLRSVQDAAGE